MSLERVIKALISLGLPRFDAEVYVYLAKKGSHNAVDLSRALNRDIKIINASLKNLQTIELVKKDNENYSALPFEEALELLIKRKKEQTEVLQEIKKELLTTWKSNE